MDRFLLRLGLCILTLALAAPDRATASEEGSGTAATPDSGDAASPIWVESQVRFPSHFSSLFYAFHTGDPVQYRLLIHNLGDETIQTPAPKDLRAGLQVTGEKNKSLSVSIKKDLPGAVLPKELQPGQIAGAIYDLTEIVPDMAKPDLYTIEWAAGDWRSNPVTVRIIPHFDEGSDYEAVLQTEEGEIRIDLLVKDAPIHVRNFVNLARLGFYDSQIFHTSSRDRSIRTGSPLNDGASSLGYQLPAEISSHRHVAGTVSMYRDLGASGSESDGSQFFICLTDLPNRDGKFTIFGQIKEGLSVAKKIGSREPSADPSLPPGTPRSPAKIHNVTIVEKPRSASSKG